MCEAYLIAKSGHQLDKTAEKTGLLDPYYRCHRNIEMG